MEYQINRAAVEVQRIERTPEEIELAQLDSQRKHFRRLTWLMIIVSVVHLASALLLFAGGTIIHQASAIGLILGLELFTAALAVHIAESRRAGHPIACMTWVTFVATLLLSFGLNTSFLWSHRPGPDKLPPLLSGSIAVLFGGFIPLSIYTGATIGGSLDTLRAAIQRGYAERALAEEKDAEERDRRAADRVARRTRVVDRTAPPVHAPALNAPAAVLPAPSANNGVDTWSLDQLLQAAGLARDTALATVAEYGMDTPGKAYQALRSTGRLPDGMEYSTFAALWSELHATTPPRTGNGKAAIGAEDVPAILAALQQAGVTSFKWQKDLCGPCDWSSETTAGKAIKALLAAGAVEQTATGYVVMMGVDHVS